MEDWFLEVGRQKENEEEITPGEIRRFTKPEDAWAYVVEHKINFFCVYKAKCVVDAT